MTPTPEQIVQATGARPEDIDEHYSSLVEAMEENAIITPLRVAHFLAQCAHESVRFRVTEENLNYSWQALRRVFPRYFPTDELAQQYHRQPRLIASRVYANRMGNGDEDSQDGWWHRGAGVIQLTGANNQRAYWEAKGDGSPLEEEQWVLTLSSPPHAARSAGWFWTVNNLNTFADRDEADAISGAINVGNPNAVPTQINGYDDRIALTEQSRSTFA